MAGDWEGRVDDHRLMVNDPQLGDALAAAGITLIGYRELRDLMRVPATGRAAQR
jgi:hypothetical protein